MTNRANANHITFNITTKQATRAAFDISSRERFTLTDPAPAGWRKLAAPRRAGKKPACIAQPIVVPFPRSFRVLTPLHGITRVRPSLPSTRSPAPAPENADLVRAPRVPRTSLHPPQCPQGSVGALLAAPSISGETPSHSATNERRRDQKLANVRTLALSMQTGIPNETKKAGKSAKTKHPKPEFLFSNFQFPSSTPTLLPLPAPCYTT